VPVLVDGSLSVHESLAISEYVAELYPEPKLWPEDRKLQARGRAIARIPSLDHPLMDGTDGVIVRRADWLSFSFSRIHSYSSSARISVAPTPKQSSASQAPYGLVDLVARPSLLDD
jgi:hypothetical protein